MNSQAATKIGPGRMPHFSSLVALRFFAAAAVVYAHCLGHVVQGLSNYEDWGFPCLMVFFHLLSGFTLAYVYPELESRAKVARFWLARVGRIWPVHVAIILGFILCFHARYTFDRDWWWKFAGNIVLVQSWYPRTDFPILFNGPAWSLSTEFSMYLLFPLLIKNWRRTWHWKLGLSFLLALGFCIFCSAGYALLYNKFAVYPDYLVYVHPCMRLFEFVLGMTLALWWRQAHERVRIRRATGTLLEVAAIAFLLAALTNAHSLAASICAAFSLGPIPEIWIGRMLVCMIPMAALLFVFSLNRGGVSSFLSHPFFVFLGELSFSIYMVHHLILQMFDIGYHGEFSLLQPWAIVCIYACCVFLAAHAMQQLWETPARNFFRHLLPPIAGEPAHTPKPEAAALPFRQTWFWLLPGAEFAAALALLGVVLYDGCLRPRVHIISAAQAETMAGQGVAEIRDVKFGDDFMLKALVPHWSHRGLQIDMVWQSLRDQPLRYTQAVHFVDKNGRLAGGMDHLQELNHARIGRGTIWVDSLFIPRDRLSGVTTLGLGIYSPVTPLLQIDHGTRDWNNGRLLVNVGTELRPPPGYFPSQKNPSLANAIHPGAPNKSAQQ